MRRFIPDPARSNSAAGQPDPEVAGQLAFWLGRVRTAGVRRLGPLDVTPLLHDGPHGQPPALLHEALADGSLQIVEEGGGVVNTVRAHNKGDRPVLILEGESIVGAKQNRVVTLDILLAPSADLQVPVGCVEQGRWHHTSGEFRSADTPVEPSMRRQTVSEMRERGHLDQGRLWSEVQHKLSTHNVVSRSSDYHEFVARKRREADAQVGDLPVLPGQVGVIAFLDGHLLGMDVLGHPGNWESLSARLVRSYVLAGMDAPAAVGAGAAGGSPQPVVTESVEGWLRRVAGAGLRVRPAAGLGVQLGLVGAGLSGGGLWWEERPAHLAVFGE